MKVLIKAVWHLIRYTIATCISIVVSGLLPYHPDIPVSALLMLGLVILVVCDCVVFVFGLALTMLSVLKNIIIRLKTRRGQ
jgi:hypothetical protein